MHQIPTQLRERLSNDPFMKTCIHNNGECSGRIEWEHALTYKNRQIQEWFSIVPVCYFHHRGGGLNKEYNRYRALHRLFESNDVRDMQAKYSKLNLLQMYNYLSQKFNKQ